MKRGGIINAQLPGALARLGHTDELVVCDAGLPIPALAQPVVVDLAFRFGVPSFEVVLDGLLEELVIESAVVAEEAAERNAGVFALFENRLPGFEMIPHEELKRRAAGGRLVVRTGEATPFSNVILRCGVPF